jgi:hypothetical protein
MTGRAILLLALLAAPAAQAQTPAAVPAQALPPRLPARPLLPPSGYCLAASAGFLEGDSKAFDEIKKCARGDTVVIPIKSASAVARICDFSKAIVTMGEYVVCVIVLPERVSK